MDGIRYKGLVAYKEGTLSLGGLSRVLGTSLSEALDLLAFFGIASPVTYDDYLDGLETAKKFV